MPRLLLIFCLLSANLNAQYIKNAGFEDWHTVPNTSGKEDPDHWESTNRLLDANLVEGVSKSTDARSGNYAVQLAPSTEAGKYTQLMLGKLPLDSVGMATYRKCQGQAAPYLPLVITGYYKFVQAQQNVQAGISVIFTSGCYNDVYVFFVSGNDAFDPNPNEYKPFAIPIQFHGSSFAELDTVVISLTIAGADTNSANSFLLVDDLAVLGEYVGIGELGLEKMAVEVFPNPTLGMLTVKCAESESYDLKVFSLHGKMVYQRLGIHESEFQFDLPDPSGVYFVEVSTSNAKRVFKVVKE